ncbi:spore germination protein [Neobacillus sp.]|uniref:spore germination protein n=1 Tax=Neobacillus sp. TaxID=2675273 RepID=UPI0028962E47|nr:spore germination protein [Neobacillus sp.]
MSIWKKLKKYFVADLTVMQDSFSLGNWAENMDNETNEEPQRFTEGMPQIETKTMDYGILSFNLDQNIDWIKKHFSYPQNHGLVVRRMAIGQSDLQAAIIYMDGLVNWEPLNRTVITPLMGMYIPIDAVLNEEFLMEHILTEGEISKHEKLGLIVNDILIGRAVVLVDGLNIAVIAGVQGWEKKAIDNPKTEMVVRGSQEGFTEDIQTNLSMIRRRLRTPELIVELGQVGSISQTDIAIVYIKSIANDDLVGEVRGRIAAIDYDYIGDSGMVEQFIEDHPNSFFPSVLSTERPDRLSAQIAEGYVGILVNNSPFGLIVPAHFPLFLQTAEDANLRWPYGTFIRIVRQVGYFMSLYLPAFYVAIANYHMEMIPTTLILAIAGTRETVPLPVAAETVLLECMFELIREAGVRIPGVIGPTIGIVGALILGQAAVQANIVSPIVVIITATTALSSYTIPNYNLQFATRILRFVYLFAASFFGLVGIVLVWLILLSNRVASNSFGVPVLSPITPHLRSNDTLIRAGMKLQKYRSLSIRPKRERKMPN